MTEIFTKQTMRVGLLFGGLVAAVTLVLDIINLIPFLICITWVLYLVNWVFLLVGGYVNGYVHGFTKENMSSNLKKAIGAGLWAALIMGVLNGILAVVFLFVTPTAYFGYVASPGILSIVSTLIGTVVGALISGLFWFIVGGIVYPYYPVSNLPASIVRFFDRVKAFASK